MFNFLKVLWGLAFGAFYFYLCSSIFRCVCPGQVSVLLKLLEIISWLSWGWLGFSLQQGHLHTVLISLAVIGLVVALAVAIRKQKTILE
jgi:hypothetical protein